MREDRWDEHLTRVSRGKVFRRMYKMEVPAFEKLVNLLRPTLESDVSFAQLGMPPEDISTETRVAIALRILAEASYLDLMHVHGVSMNTVFICVWQVVDAINNTAGVEGFKFAQKRADRTRTAARYKELSKDGLVGGDVEAVDEFYLVTGGRLRYMATESGPLDSLASAPTLSAGRSLGMKADGHHDVGRGEEGSERAKRARREENVLSCEESQQK